MTSSQSTPPLPSSFPTCPHCGAQYVGNDTTCGSCGKFLPIAYTGPTQRLENARPVLDPIQIAAPALPVVDAQTERAILDELARTNNHQEAARIVIAAYQCHWDVALQIVETVEKRNATSQANQKAGSGSTFFITLLTTIALLVVLLVVMRLLVH